MSANFISRILGMVVFAFLLGWGGTALAGAVDGSRPAFQVIFGLVGALIGLVSTPYLTVVPIRRLRRAVKKIPIHRLFLDYLLFGLRALKNDLLRSEFFLVFKPQVSPILAEKYR